MDLALLTTSDTADCVIIDPFTGEETDIVITLYGAYSDQYSKALKNAASSVKEAKDSKGSGLQLLADLTVDWSGVQSDGEDFPFNNENALMLYEASGDIRKQVNRFIQDSKNFLPKR